MFEIIGASAEFERALIDARVKAGLAKGSDLGDRRRDCRSARDRTVPDRKVDHQDF